MVSFMVIGGKPLELVVSLQVSSVECVYRATTKFQTRPPLALFPLASLISFISPCSLLTTLFRPQQLILGNYRQPYPLLKLCNSQENERVLVMSREPWIRELHLYDVTRRWTWINVYTQSGGKTHMKYLWRLNCSI